MDSQSVITRTITVAGGVFAPGHLGELTQIVPFEMVDEVLTQTNTTQQRLRKLPSRVVVYLLLAAGLFAEIGYRGVWGKLIAGLDGLALPTPSTAALWQARKRLGVAPLRALFDLLRGPTPSPRSDGARWRGLLVTAIDGTTTQTPDSAGNHARWGRHTGGHGEAGYPHVRLLALVACGSRALVDAVFGPLARGENTLVHRLFRSLHAGMIVLLDRGFGSSNAVIAGIAGTGAQVLVRLKSNRRAPVLARYPDGSSLSVLGGVRVRVIEGEITIATVSGRRTGVYRLATTLLDHHRYPALEIMKLYHHRWEIETVYLELKTTLLGNRVLRAHHPEGIAQEIYALLTVYQVLRIAITDATPGIDPTRASFTVALHTARDCLIQAAGVIAGTVIDLVGSIGHRVLDNLLPPRRPRTCPRAVKRPLSRYAHQSLRIDRTTYKATLKVSVCPGQSVLTTSGSP